MRWLKQLFCKQLGSHQIKLRQLQSMYEVFKERRCISRLGMRRRVNTYDGRQIQQMQHRMKVIDLANDQLGRMYRELKEERDSLKQRNKIIDLANDQLELANYKLQQQQKQALRALELIAVESNCDGASRNLSRSNMYANEAIDKITGRNVTEDALQQVKGKEEER